MESKTQEFSLNCILLSTKNMKKSYYIIATLFHGGSSKFEKHVSKLDTTANIDFKFKDVNVETAYVRFQVFIHRNLLSNKHVGDVNVLVSDLVLAGEQSSSSSVMYDLGGKSSKKGSLKLSYTLSSNVGKEMPRTVVPKVVESKRQSAAIGNDIALFKTLPSYCTPFVSLGWN
ncbi:hypothetical protein RND81_02G042600 [Saponaria officinalis]|uniref:Uncharacterized protein n=1 Tax=Saponaria officinalis TaxID=3572 RepID=A0AAW1MJT6_SAPOF